MAINDKVIDGYIKNNIYVNRYVNSLKQQLENIIKSLEISIISAILESSINTALVAKKQYEIGKLNKTISILIEEAFDKFSGLLVDDKRFAENQSNLLGEIISDVLQSVAILNLFDINKILKQTKIEGLSTQQWWNKQKQHFKSTLRQQLRTGIMANETIDQLIYRFIGGTSGTGEVYRGILPVLRHRASALINTTIGTISNNILDANHKINSDIIAGYQHLSVMDKRTTKTCFLRNGLFWNNNKEPEGHNTQFALPPLHWHCRSIMVPVLKGYKDLPSTFKSQIPKGKRKKFSLKRPNIITFEQFLNNQTKQFQIEYLGNKRYKLWKQGRLDLQDFINDENNFLSITGLKGK